MMSEPGPGRVPPHVAAAARVEVEAVMRDVSAVRAVVVATSDGFELASSAGGTLDARRIAALASSIAAIGDVVSSEAGLGSGTRVTVATDAGFALVHHVSRSDCELVINAIGSADAVLAQVNYRIAEAARRLAQA